MNASTEHGGHRPGAQISGECHQHLRKTTITDLLGVSRLQLGSICASPSPSIAQDGMALCPQPTKLTSLLRGHLETTSPPARLSPELFQRNPPRTMVRSHLGMMTS